MTDLQPTEVTLTMPVTHLEEFSGESPITIESYSGINTYQRCPHQYHYKQVQKIQRKKRNLNLFNGINGHEMLKAFFLKLRELQQAGEDGDHVELAREDMRQQALDLIEANASTMFEDELTDAKGEVETLLLILERYIDQYADDWTILHVEEEFQVTLDTGAVVTFTPDLVVMDRNGSIWIIDHKTTTGTVETGIPFGDMQALFYFAGVKAIYPETKGFIFNRIRKKVPTQPRLTKTGATRVADLARIDTTFEILRDFLQAKAPGLLSDGAHQRRLAELRDQGDKFFWTEQVYVNEDTIEAIVNDVANVIEHIELSRKQDYWPRHLLESRGYKDCRKCEFQPLCHGEMVGWNTDMIREEEYEPRDPKNPYDREDDE